MTMASKKSYNQPLTGKWGFGRVVATNEQTRNCLDDVHQGWHSNYDFDRSWCSAHPRTFSRPRAVDSFLPYCCIIVRVTPGHRTRRATGEGAALGTVERWTAQLNAGRGNPAAASAGRDNRSVGTVDRCTRLAREKPARAISGGGPHTDTTRWALPFLLLPSVPCRGERQCFQPCCQPQSIPIPESDCRSPLPLKTLGFLVTSSLFADRAAGWLPRFQPGPCLPLPFSLCPSSGAESLL